MNVQIYVMATQSDWDRAQDTGLLGATAFDRDLAGPGMFAGAPKSDLDRLRRRYSLRAEPTLMLLLDTDLLPEPVQSSPDGLYLVPGPIPTQAVLKTRPLSAPRPSGNGLRPWLGAAVIFGVLVVLAVLLVLLVR